VSQNVRCPTCKVEMERGFTVDYAHGMVLQSTWHAGEPTEAKLLGFIGGLGVESDRHSDPKIISYRCPECHLLLNYTT
jgi:hypothetical protein